MKSSGYNQVTDKTQAGNVESVPSSPFQKFKPNWRDVLWHNLREYAASHPEFLHGGKVSLRAFSLAIGENPTLLWEWLEKKPPKEPQFSSIAKLMSRLGLSVAILTESGDSAIPSGQPRSAPLIGVVEAGVWREPKMLDLDDAVAIPHIPEPKFRHLEQFSWRVRGKSINRIADDGSYLITVRFLDLHRQPNDGELVVCERHRQGEVEYTAKVIHYSKDGIQLVPDSTDPRFQEPLWRQSEEKETDTEVRTEHLVIGVYRPIR